MAIKSENLLSPLGSNVGIYLENLLNISQSLMTFLDSYMLWIVSTICDGFMNNGIW